MGDLTRAGAQLLASGGDAAHRITDRQDGGVEVVLDGLVGAGDLGVDHRRQVAVGYLVQMIGQDPDQGALLFMSLVILGFQGLALGDRGRHVHAEQRRLDRTARLVAHRGVGPANPALAAVLAQQMELARDDLAPAQPFPDRLGVRPCGFLGRNEGAVGSSGQFDCGAAQEPEQAFVGPQNAAVHREVAGRLGPVHGGELGLELLDAARVAGVCAPIEKSHSSSPPGTRRSAPYGPRPDEAAVGARG